MLCQAREAARRVHSGAANGRRRSAAKVGIPLAAMLIPVLSIKEGKVSSANFEADLSAIHRVTGEASGGC